MSASAGVRGSSSSSSSSSLKSSSSLRTTLALSVFRRLLIFDLLRVGESRLLLGGCLRLLLLSRSSFSCSSMAWRHRLVRCVCSPANLVYALSSSLVAFLGSSLPSLTASFTIAMDSLDKRIFSLGGAAVWVAGACCLLPDGWVLGPGGCLGC